MEKWMGILLSGCELKFMEKIKYWVGTSGWNYLDWKGSFYPEDLPQSKWFEYYCSQFEAVEVNATFYRFFPKSTYENWAKKTPPKFRFVLKVPRLISHLRLLNNVNDLILRFCNDSGVLGEKIGLYLLQLSPKFPLEPERLQIALEAFPDPTKVAVEFRTKADIASLVAILKAKQAVYCVADSPLLKMQPELTSSIGYLRLHGRKQWFSYLYNPEEIQEIVRIAQKLVNKGAKEVYIFFNNTTMGWAADNALAVKTALGAL
ncbi:hypothetical protein A7Q09_06395 [Methylacidiphilum sp. Yel]|nr:hypothetical protein A7Q09_06395 [Methylacidiphilum sp. Yel]